MLSEVDTRELGPYRGTSPTHDVSGTARTDCRPRQTPAKPPPLAVSRQSHGSPKQVVSGYGIGQWVHGTGLDGASRRRGGGVAHVRLRLSSTAIERPGASAMPPQKGRAWLSTSTPASLVVIQVQEASSLQKWFKSHLLKLIRPRGADR